MAFFPKDYEPQQGASGYYRLKTGKNQFRAVGPALVGFEAWTTDGDKRKPVRRRMDNDGNPTPPYGPGDYDADGKVKQIVFFPVIDRHDGQVKIAQFHQSSILGSMQSLSESEDWGDPNDAQTGYDIIVDRKGAGLDTEYSVVPGKAKPLTADELAAIAAKPMNLDALFDNGDPFASNNGHAASAPSSPPEESTTTTQVNEVKMVLVDGKEKFGIVCADGKTYGTFSKARADKAQSLAALQEDVQITFTTDGKRLTLVDIGDDIPF